MNSTEVDTANAAVWNPEQRREIRNASILGTGSYLPETIMTNDDLSKIVETNDEWINARTGIRARRIAKDEEYCSDMGAIAGRRALEDAGIAPEELDLIVLATSTPDMIYPSTACFVQALLGATNAAAFDLTAACSGFAYALDVGAKYVASGGAKHVLVIGSEKKSAVLNWKDRSVCVLFGDGAAAAVLGAREGSRGIFHSYLGADGKGAASLYLANGGMRPPLTKNPLGGEQTTIQMNGREIYKFAVNIIGECLDKTLRDTGLSLDDIACIIPHQANQRILESIASKRGFPLEKFYINLDKYGNTSAAAAGIALDEAAREGRIKRGDLVLIIAFGGGMTWGSALLEW